MKYRCVSYPEFEPDHTWLRQILLFVDEIHRIVPLDIPADDSEHLKRLMDCCPGAVHRCPPRGFAEISPDLAALFGQALDQPRFTKIVKSKEFKVRPYGDKIEIDDWEFLHFEKIGAHVRTELERRGMLWDFKFDSRWLSVPRGVGGLVVSMVAEQIAHATGFDAITDQPLAFALNGLHGCSAGPGSHVEGIIGSAIVTAHVPRSISLLPPEEYRDLRDRFSGVRAEFARMTRELKDESRIDRINDPKAFRARLDDIVEHIGIEMEKCRKSRAIGRFNDWVPLTLTTLVPIAAAYAFGLIPGAITGGFSFAVNAAAKLR